MTPDDAHHESFMRIAIEACREGIENGQTPFAACLVQHNRVLAVTHNQVWANNDPTAHAEVLAIRRACADINSIFLKNMTIYSTTEPCPMCFSAIHWARIGQIVYAASIEDARSFGFNELSISNRILIQSTNTSIQLVPQVLRKEAIELFKIWQKRNGNAY